jgi:hypothetical protein
MIKYLRNKPFKGFKWLTAIFLSLSVSAQISMRPPANNEEKFMHLNGAIRGVKSLQIICNRNFPEYIKQNEQAYMKWSLKFKKYIDEVKIQYSHWIEVQATKENTKVSEIEKVLNNYMLAGQNQNERNYLKKHDNFKNVCENFPKHLESKTTNIKLIVEKLNN